MAQTWNGPGNNWNTAANWTPAAVPDAPGEVATFGAAGPLIPVISAPITIDGITFGPAAAARFINSQSVTVLQGVGIVNASGVTQTIVNSSPTGLFQFLGGATAGNVTINNTGSGPFPAAVVAFNATSNAGTATINNSGDNSQTVFSDNSSAGNVGASITNSGAGSSTAFFVNATAGDVSIVNTGVGSFTEFRGSSSGGNSLITNDNATSSFISFLDTSTAGNAALNNLTATGIIQFFDTSTLGTAFILNDGSAAFPASIVGFSNNSSAANGLIFNSGGNSQTYFSDNSNGGNATIDNSGAGSSTAFFANSNAGSATIGNTGNAAFVDFNDASSAGSATINNNAAFGTVNFLNTSTAGGATINNNGPTGLTNFLQNSSAGSATINNAGSGAFPSSIVGFFNDSTAADAIISNSGSNSQTLFSDTSVAGNAVVTNSGAGSSTVFIAGASGGNASLVNANSTAVIDISQLTTAGTTLGSIAGSGELFLGSKNLAVGGNNTSTIFSGIIQDGSSPVLGGPGGVGGSFTKAGAATLTLTGNNTFTGGVFINGGAIAVGAPRALGLGNVTVGNGGSLLTSGGPRTINVAGNYTQLPGGTLVLGIAGAGAGQADKVSAGGAASLAGTVRVVRLGGFTPSATDKITLVEAAGGVSGTFDTFDSGFSGVLEFGLAYLPTSVVLQLVGSDFVRYASTPNQLSVATALDAVALKPQAGQLVSYLGSQSIGALPADYDRISPSELTAFFQTAINNSNLDRLTLKNRMEAVRAGSVGGSGGVNPTFSAITNIAGDTMNIGGSVSPARPSFRYGESKQVVASDKAGKDLIPTPEHRRGFFATGVGDFADLDSDFNAPGYNAATGGFLMGVDYLVRPGLVVGIVGGYTRSDVDYASGGSLTVDTGKAGVYATAFTDRFHADFYAGGGYNSYDSRRNGLAGTASADPDGGQFDTFLSTGYDLKLGHVTLTPFLDVHYTYVGLSDFQETGSLAPLQYSSQNINSLRTALGAAIKYRHGTERLQMTSEVRAAWQHEYLDNNYSIDSTFAFGGPTFGAWGPVTGRDALLLGVTLGFQFSPTMGAYLAYDAQLARHNYSSQSVSGGMRINF